MGVDRRISLYGTTEPEIARERYAAGPLSFTFEGGGVRHVRFRGVEVVRGIAYLLRDANWATPAIEMGEVVVETTSGALRLAFDGRVRSGEIEFDFKAEIAASASGELRFGVEGIAGSAFAANRVGFTVLHPTPECEDIALDVEHLDGVRERTRFPLEVSPAQPVLDIRALEYAPAPGLHVRCELRSVLPDGREGPFEMEDQRNWSDASFKTYVGSLLEPWPYDVAAGEVFDQSVTVRCSGAATAVAPGSGRDGALRLTLGPATRGVAGAIGLAVPQHAHAEAIERIEGLRSAGVQHLTAYLPADRSELAQAVAALASALSLPVELEVELPLASPPREELERLAAACTAAGLRPASVLACPAAYLKSYQPSGRWPDVPPLGAIYAAARGAFPDARIGGGMLSYFTELNRKWPPADAIDFVSHTVSPLVHAGDDETLMENLATIPAMAATVEARLGAVEHRLGPCAISMRHNPYGSATLENADGTRMAMGDADPRERALFGAAWALGLAASALAGGIRHMTLFAASGPRSVLYAAGPRSQPWFDDAHGAAVRPVFHVVRGLAGLAGAPVLEAALEGEGARAVAVIAAEVGAGAELWLANLTASAARVALPAQTRVIVLDASSFEAACRDPDWLDNAPAAVATQVELDAYAVARCRIRS